MENATRLDDDSGYPHDYGKLQMGIQPRQSVIFSGFWSHGASRSYHRASPIHVATRGHGLNHVKICVLSYSSMVLFQNNATQWYHKIPWFIIFSMHMDLLWFHMPSSSTIYEGTTHLSIRLPVCNASRYTMLSPYTQPNLKLETQFY